MQQRFLPGRGSGGLSWTWPAGTALPSAASFSSAGFNPSKPSMMPCMVSCGVWPFFTALEMSTTPRSVIRPGVTSPLAAHWNRTSFTNSLPSCFGAEYSTSPAARPADPKHQPAAHIRSVAARPKLPFPHRLRYRPRQTGRARQPPSIQGEGTMAVIKVTDIAYARLRAPDLDLQAEFLENFGLVQSAKTGNAIY